MGGEAEGAAPSGCQAAFVLDHRDGFLAGVAPAVAPFPGGCAEGNVLGGIEQVGCDADHAMTALCVFDGQERSGFSRPAPKPRLPEFADRILNQQHT